MGSDEIRVYHRPAAGHARLRRKLFLRTFGMVAIIGGTMAVVQGAPSGGAGWLPNLFPLAVLLVIGAAIGWKVSGQVVTHMMSYQLTLGPNLLRVTVVGAGPVELSRSEITQIRETGGGLQLRSERVTTGVPRDLQGYDEVRARLSEWRAIDSRSQKPAVWAMGLFGVLFLAAMFIDSLPATVVVPTCLAGPFVFGWSTRELLRSQAPGKQKANMVIGVVLISLMCVGRIVRVLGWLQ